MVHWGWWLAASAGGKRAARMSRKSAHLLLDVPDVPCHVRAVRGCCTTTFGPFGPVEAGGRMSLRTNSILTVGDMAVWLHELHLRWLKCQVPKRCGRTSSQ
ncbi:hypothetical protein J3459_013599 [Metarhizium acridum]|nr:hypothetical protein J3459_013599 [Metarhizium acridum]